MKDLVAALRETVLLINRSEDSPWTHLSVMEIKNILNENIAALEDDGSYQRQTLAGLFGPTGSIQETAISNGWSDDYMRIAAVVDLYTERQG